MAERTNTRKRPSRQAVAEVVAETEKSVAERKEAEAKPEDRAAARSIADAVAVADALSSEGAVRSIAELKTTITRTLVQLSDRLEEEAGKYNQVRRAIDAKEAELKEIYEIQAHRIDPPGDARNPPSAPTMNWNGHIRPKRTGYNARSKQHAGNGTPTRSGATKETKERDGAEQKLLPAGTG